MCFFLGGGFMAVYLYSIFCGRSIVLGARTFMGYILDYSYLAIA